jgi:diguanylate cyclase (GGDEF)-like protein
VAETSAERSAGSDPRERRAAATWRLIAALFVVVAVLLVVDVVRSLPPDPIALAVAIGVGALAALAVAYHREVLVLAQRQRVETESLNRILQGLSRSSSPDAVLSAIADELRKSTGADHCVVVRRRPRSRLLEATLVSGSASVGDTATTLPSVLLDVGPGDDDAPAAIAARISDAAGELFGLENRHAAPLVSNRVPIGALVLSMRREMRWTPAASRLLEEAAAEASVALDRAFAYAATEEAATTDPLTGLPNRRFLEILAAQPRGRRRDDNRAVLMVDIDHFKRVNDRFGHDTGDEVLRAVAEAIARTVRTDDFPIRYGGEEFLVVLRRADREIAVAVAERLRRNVARVDLQRLHVTSPVTVSVGIAVEQPARGAQRDGLPTLITSADEALYRAKSAGRDRIVVAGGTLPAP